MRRRRRKVPNTSRFLSRSRRARPYGAAMHHFAPDLPTRFAAGLENRIAVVRAQRRLSLRELARRTGLDHVTIARVEAGRSCTILTATRLAIGLGVSVDVLWPTAALAVATRTFDGDAVPGEARGRGGIGVGAGSPPSGPLTADDVDALADLIDDPRPVDLVAGAPDHPNRRSTR